MARAAVSQFVDVVPVEHVWSFVRTESQVEKVLSIIETLPGLVIFTVVSPELRQRLEEGCRRIGVPSVAVLDATIHALAGILGQGSQPQVGRQHEMDEGYFSRIDAMNFMLRHDDGQFTDELDEADIVLIGVSRTSKTPTSIYLANRGYKVGNIPIVPGIAPPPVLDRLQRPLVVGLTINAEALSHIRTNRLKQLKVSTDVLPSRRKVDDDYIEVDKIRAELLEARRLLRQYRWPVIDVTKRSVEETAAEIMQMMQSKTIAAMKEPGAPGS